MIHHWAKTAQSLPLHDFTSANINLCLWTDKTLQANNPLSDSSSDSQVNINETLQLVAQSNRLPDMIRLFRFSLQKVFTIIKTSLFCVRTNAKICQWLINCSVTSGLSTNLYSPTLCRSFNSANDNKTSMMIRDYPSAWVIALVTLKWHRDKVIDSVAAGDTADAGVYFGLLFFSNNKRRQVLTELSVWVITPVTDQWHQWQYKANRSCCHVVTKESVIVW